ncbi:Uncharacterised protein [Klebsiella pneumoniae]|nr:Uncharacterised protein [Klebsiella pneumoniae]
MGRKRIQTMQLTSYLIKVIADTGHLPKQYRINVRHTPTTQYMFTQTERT